MHEPEKKNRRSVYLPKGQVYDLPHIKLKQHNSQSLGTKNDIPVYLAGDAKVYALSYAHLPSGDAMLKEILDALPMPKPYENKYRAYQDYEKAVSEWEQAVTQRIQNLVLPDVLGRFFSRPTLPSDSEATGVEDETSTTNALTDTTDKDDTSAMEETSLETPLKAKQPRFKELDTLKESETFKPETAQTLTYESDRWESLLIYPEPNPLFYNTYEDYAMAMENWASLVHTKHKFIPMHSRQLSTLIPLINFNELERVDPYKWLPDGFAALERKGNEFLWCRFFCDPFPALNCDPAKIAHLPLVRTKNDALFEENIIRAVDKYLDLFLNHQQRSVVKQGNGKHMIYTHDCYGDTHLSTVPKPSLLSTSEGGGVYLRRTPIVTDENQKYKVGEKIRSVAAFGFPVVEGQLVDMPRNEITISQAKENFTKLLHRYRNHDMYAWYNPSKVSDQTIQEQVSQIKEMLDSFSEEEKISMEDITKLLGSSFYPDLFNMVLDPPEDDHGYVSFASSSVRDKKGLLAFYKKFNYSELIGLFEVVYNSTNKKMHAIVSLILFDLLRHGFSANEILDRWLKIENMSYISVLPYLLHMFNPVERDLFPYNDEVIALMQQVIGTKDNNFKELIKKVFKLYYIEETRTNLLESKYVEANNVLLRHSMPLIKDISLLFKKDSSLLAPIVKAVGHRSPTVSNGFLFLLIQLLKKPDISVNILDPRLKLYQHITQLCTSKLRHVKNAVTRLLDFLLVNFGDDLKRYLKNDELHLSIIFKPVPIFTEFVVHRVIISDLNKWMNGKTECVEPPPKTDVNYTREKMYNCWWIDETIISKLILSIKTPNETTIETAKVLKMIAKVIWKEKMKQDKKSPLYSIKISSDCLNHLSKFLALLTGPQLPYHETQVVTFIISAIRYFFKIPEYFSILNNANLHSSITSFLNHPYIQLNYEAWQSFYNIIKYNQGQLESWINEGRVLKFYFNALTVVSGVNAMQNGLEVLNKILTGRNSKPSKTDKDKKKDKKKGEDSKSESKSEIKILVQYFITQRFFVNIHMIYQNVIKKTPGPAYHAVMKFYVSLMTNSNLSKLLKDCQKNTQYKADIEQVTAVLKGPLEKAKKKSIMWI